MLFLNGEIPPPGSAGSPLVVIATGIDSNGYWEFQITAATFARWQAAKRYAEQHFGRTIYIRTGWNVYRPLNIQWDAYNRAKRQGNPLGAAYPKTSSHGGNWRGRDCLAIDVDPNGLTWAQVWEACRAAGFECGLITAQMSGFSDGEPWHVIDFNAFGPVPAGLDVSIFTPQQLPQEDSDMRAIRWNKQHVFVIGQEQITHVDNYDLAVAAAVIHNPDKVWMELDNNGLTAALITYGVPWYAVDACLKGVAHTTEGGSGGRYWSRTNEIKFDIAISRDKLATSIDGLAKTAATAGGTIDVEMIADAVNDEADQRARGRLAQ